MLNGLDSQVVPNKRDRGTRPRLLAMDCAARQKHLIVRAVSLTEHTVPVTRNDLYF